MSGGLNVAGALLLVFGFTESCENSKQKPKQVQKPGAPVTKQRVQKQKPNCAQKPARALARGRAAARLHARAQWCRASDCAPACALVAGAEGKREARMQAVYATAVVSTARAVARTASTTKTKRRHNTISKKIFNKSTKNPQYVKTPARSRLTSAAEGFFSPESSSASAAAG